MTPTPVRRAVAAGVLMLAVASAHADAYEDFFIAIRNDNASLLGSLLKRGLDPNTVDPSGQPGLVLAMKEQSPKAAQALLDQAGIDVNRLNAAGESALMMAALKGDVAGIRTLIERGARVDQPGWSPLHYAASGPEPKAVQLLLERGAAVDALSPNGSTPLMLAAQYGSEESVKLLLQKGADPRRRNQKNLTAADFAGLAGRESLVAQLQRLQR